MSAKFTKVPVVEVSPLGTHTDIVFVPLEDIDDFLGSISSNYNLGLGELSAELGVIKVKAKASVNVKAKTPAKPTSVAKKPAPKLVAKKPAPKPVVKKPAPKLAAKKPAPKPAAKKPAPKPIAKVPVKKTVAKVVVKKPATKVSAKVAVKTSPAKKPVLTPKTSKNLLALAKKATVVLGKAKATAKPVAIKTTIKAGPILKLKPTVSARITTPAKQLAVVNKVASLATSIKTLPVAAQKSLAMAVSESKKPDSDYEEPSSESAEPIKKPIKIAEKIERLNEISESDCTTCIVASKKPAQAAVNDRPEVAVSYQKFVDAANLPPEQFKSEVISYLKQIEGNCSSQVLKAKLQKLARASGVLNVTA